MAGDGAESGVTANDAGGAIAAYSSTLPPPFTHYGGRVSLFSDAVTRGLDLRADSITGDIRFYTGGFTPSNETMRITDTGQVGIGIKTPNANTKFHVDSNDDLYAGYFSTNYWDSEIQTHVVHAEYTGVSVTILPPVAVYGNSDSNGRGYGGMFEGGTAGVFGTVSSTGDSHYWGVYGNAYGGQGYNYGVKGYASGSGTNYGVYGFADDGTTNWAGYFDGNVQVDGSINKSACSFKIDHPLEPESKYLYHSVVESPDMKNVYDGMAVLDSRGEAVVELDVWFEALNRDFRYQLTCIGGFAPVYVAEKISNNQFKIAGGEPGMEVSWQVTGIRQDAYAELNRIQVEEDKPEKERGLYLHPEAYGLPTEKGIASLHDHELPKIGKSIER